MQYRIDKKTGNKLSVLGFGCMRFPGIFGRPDMQKTEEMVMYSIEKGVNYFDTAWIYPGSEETIGTIFKKNNVRDRIYIATKLPLVFLNGSSSAVDFDRYFNQSLQRLKTDYVDYYHMHMITDLDQWQKLKKAGIENWITEKKKSGQIRQVGFSFHGTGSEFLKILYDYDWEFSLIQYNYSGENYQAGKQGVYAAAAKMPVVVMEPLLGGKLVTGLPKEAVKIFQKADANLSPAGWALNWLWNQEEVTTLISGMSNMEQLEENLRLADAAAAGMLNDSQHIVYKSVLEYVNRASKILCTGCNYCMPCPKGIDIPSCFAAYNVSFMQNFLTGLSQYITSIAGLTKKQNSPRYCTECGRCESHCPQNLPIRKLLKRVAGRLETIPIRFGLSIVRFLFSMMK